MEVKTLAFIKKGVEPQVFSVGDLVDPEKTSKKELFDGGFCPKCLEQGRTKIVPVTLRFAGGFFVSVHF